MATAIVMPRLSDSMEEGTVVRWLKQLGDRVAVGESLVEIETDKATMTYESDLAGVLLELLAAEGETLPIGALIARIGDPGQPSGDDAGPPVAAGRGSDPSAPAAPPAPAKGPGASPVARRMAAGHGVELAAIAGSGPGGRIVKADVEAAIASAAAAPGAAVPDPAPPTPVSQPPAVTAAEPSRATSAKGTVSVVELTRLRQTVARRMSESRATVPHFSVTATVDMSQAVALRGRLGELVRDGEPTPSINDIVVKACAAALREQPRANAAWQHDRIELYSRVNVGIAVAAADALLVPTVFDADAKGLGQIAGETRALAGDARDGRIVAAQLEGGTFTVSNLGMYGVDAFEAVVNPPQAAILAVGALAPRPVVDDRGRVAVRETATLTLACDHRVLYGADGAELLARIRALLESPLALAL